MYDKVGKSYYFIESSNNGDREGLEIEKGFELIFSG